METMNIDLNEDVFIYPKEHYKRNIDLIGHYIEQQSKFLSIMRDIPLDKATDYIKNLIRKNGKHPLIDPKVIYVRKDENDDRVEDTTTMYRYLKETIEDRDILTAPFTTYIAQDKKLSYISKYVDAQFPKRSKKKKEQFACKQKGDLIGAAFANNAQNKIKRSINSISGASSITSVPIYQASMHPVLTSTCRMTSGYANANNEKLLGGNRHYHSPEVTLNNLIAMVCRIDEANIASVLDEYQLYTPTADELYQDIMESAHQYWRWGERERVIKEFISKLNREQRASIAFTYDLYLMRKYNPNFTRSFILGLCAKDIARSNRTHEEAKDITLKAKESIRNIAIQIHGNSLIGLRMDEWLELDIVYDIAETILNIYRVFKQHQSYIECFLRSDHVPTSLAKLPHALRHVVLMSDTDSSIFTLQDWVEWICGEDYQDDKNELAAAVSANMVGLSDATLKHILANMSANLGVSTVKIHDIAMKNEFLFETFTVMSRTKHYIASIRYQEGNIYRELDIEKKGVHLKNSNSPREIIDHAEDIMKRLFYFYQRNEISLHDILTEVASIERQIIKGVEEGNMEYYRSRQIKSEETYKAEGTVSPYRNYIFWNETFGEHYGFTASPPYTSVDVALEINNKTQWKKFLESIDNQDLRLRIEDYMRRNKKDYLASINLPYEVFIGKPIPKEIIPWVAKKHLIANICSPYYIALEAVGIHMLEHTSSRLLSDLY